MKFPAINVSSFLHFVTIVTLIALNRKIKMMEQGQTIGDGYDVPAATLSNHRNTHRHRHLNDARSLPRIKPGTRGGNSDKPETNIHEKISELERHIASLEHYANSLDDLISDLEHDISNIQLIPGPQGPQGEPGSIENLYPKVDQLIRCMDDPDDNTDKNIKFSECNINIRSGTGSTDSDPNGYGNLIVGYDEFYDACDEFNDCEKTGSHNIVVGNGHTYTSFGGIIAGEMNRITNNYASVLGGHNNTASGYWSSVSGGGNNTASHLRTSVTGGFSNTASADAASVMGGKFNAASAVLTSVSGGLMNHASSEYASVSGGLLNTASGKGSSISGGEENEASGQYSSILGGTEQIADGNHQSLM